MTAPYPANRRGDAPQAQSRAAGGIAVNHAAFTTRTIVLPKLGQFTIRATDTHCYSPGMGCCPQAGMLIAGEPGQEFYACKVAGWLNSDHGRRRPAWCRDHEVPQPNPRQEGLDL